MGRFTGEEIVYLQGHRIGRLATVNSRGQLHVVPIAYVYNAEHETIDIGGHGFTTSKKYRDALRHGQVAIVVDDTAGPGKPRLVEVRGTVQALPDGGTAINQGNPPEIIRITPTYIVSMGVNDDDVRPAEGNVRYHGRRVE
jgi:pyridoxamine 5'-phosphate oxidase family protein